MAVDIILKLDQIKGESKREADGIDVLSWSWGLSNGAAGHHGGGLSTGRANFQDLQFTKYVDLSSGALMTACASGKPVKTATLIVRKSSGDGKKPMDYVTIKLTNAQVTHVSTGGTPHDELETEHVTLHFTQVDYTYNAQKDDNTKGGESTFKWDVATNKAK